MNPESYGVLLPLRELELLAKAAERVLELEMEVASMNKRLSALHGLYSELLAKVQELDKLV